ncbi:hypothetical protein AMR41_26910 [Hapalosiphon sp. MRB220]|nr:hypothetical protein AMR41_26910 [Hapalosiphon sp. MRB220]
MSRGVQIPDFSKDTAGESGVSPLIERFFVIPTDVETRLSEAMRYSAIGASGTNQFVGERGVRPTIRQLYL